MLSFNRPILSTMHFYQIYSVWLFRYCPSKKNNILVHSIRFQHSCYMCVWCVPVLYDFYFIIISNRCRWMLQSLVCTTQTLIEFNILSLLYLDIVTSFERNTIFAIFDSGFRTNIFEGKSWSKNDKTVFI